MAGAAKARRQRELLALLSRRAVGSQRQLCRLLAGRGHRVAQSTLSRDLKELGVVRAPADGGYRYVLPAGGATSPPGAARLAPAEVTAVEAADALVVVHTLVGRAGGVAVHLDGLRWREILATVAGDDTVLVVPRARVRPGALARRLRRLLGLVP